MKLPRIVGIAGTNGAGKDTLGELLAERSGYKFQSVSDILREELARQDIPHSRENLRALSTRWAKEYGPGILTIKTIEAYAETEIQQGYSGLAIGSIRRIAEARAVQQEGGAVIWVDADRYIRYTRAQQRDRTDTDRQSFREWARQEDIEMTPAENSDDTTINLRGVCAIADICVQNNFDSNKQYRDYLIREFEL